VLPSQPLSLQWLAILILVKNAVLDLTLLQVVFYWILVMRHIAHFFETHPNLRPEPPPRRKSLPVHRITLSDTQLSQINEIFDLFDTDGGGSIDSLELGLALVALGFQKEGPATKIPGHVKSRSKGSASIDSIVKDGTVTRAEFRCA
jgi:hypothetical protein